MKVVQICTNAMSGSVGTIVRNLCDSIKESGGKYLLCYGRGKIPKGYNFYKFDNKIDIYYHAIMTRMFDSDGLHSVIATKRLIKKIKQFSPDIVHIHCLHGYYINYPMLFKYFRDYNIKVIWTMHDCWAFTGHCCYYDFYGCTKWKNDCNSCKYKNTYPKSYIFSNSRRNHKKKNNIFCGINNNLTIVLPSNWLANEIKKSFFKYNEICVINNGIDRSIFKKNMCSSIVLEKYNIDINKKIILGVASVWDLRKGLTDFIELSKYLNDQYQIVLVGLNKKQINQLPKNIVGVERTSNIDELVSIYNFAHVLFNPTYEDNYPTVNLEAISCGTPVITYNTGGSGEAIMKSNYGYVVEKKDYSSIIKLLNTLNLNISLNENGRFIDKKNMSYNYMRLYEEKCNENKKSSIRC